ncbi:MAG: YbhB/YbcL family Raf kinase inhibitor-like protein [Candidatus Nanoarchaeia archaeon]|nr:YbhB/YbcL family Raf kinase inhibitor-like protein [Candidatus Nanoarchaeia archaeon]
MKITSIAFNNNGFIPKKYSYDEENINPPLEIEDIPKETKTLALIMDDPTAVSGIWIHWIVWNINSYKIKENSIPGIEGINSSGENTYEGPSPPSGTHKYFFKIYALDIKLNIKNTSKKEDLEKAMQNHILAKAEIIGLYRK